MTRLFDEPGQPATQANAMVGLIAEAREVKNQIAQLAAAHADTVAGIDGAGPLTAPRFFAEVVDITCYPQPGRFRLRQRHHTSGPESFGDSSGLATEAQFSSLPSRSIGGCGEMSAVTTLLELHDRVLLTGDSVTDWGRDRSDPTSLGHGYALIVAALAGARRPDLDLTFLNRGVGGDTAALLRARWASDGLALAPTVVSVLIGINDTWRRFDSGRTTSTDSYESDLRAVLDSARDELGARLVLIEPFAVAVSDDQRAWRTDLDPRIGVVRRLAAEYRAVLVPVDGLFAAAAVHTAPQVWTADGVHPTPAGHGLLAQAWLDAVGVG